MEQFSHVKRTQQCRRNLNNGHSKNLIAEYFADFWDAPNGVQSVVFARGQSQCGRPYHLVWIPGFDLTIF